MSYIEQYFEGMGFSIQITPEYIPFVDIYKLQHRSPDVSTVLRWGNSSYDKLFWESIKHKLKTILFKGVEFDVNTTYDKEKLQQFIEANYPNLSPDEKLDSLLEYISNISKYEGEPLQLESLNDDDANKLYFTNAQEWSFYMETATALKLVEKSVPDRKMAWHLTIAGLTRLIKVKENTSSRYCFVAMAFDEEMNSLYSYAIEPALIATGFIPIRVDKVHVPSDKTINDEIISGIKKARFTIADFTNHKDGVYFEAGYALGRGKKVIYSCRQDQINQAHFDIRNYQHIIWHTTSDFKEKLINKIEAFIKD